MRLMSILLAGALAACHSSKGSQVARAEGEDFTRYHRLGVLAFDDPRGGGVAISDEIKRELAKRMYEPVDTDALQKVLKKYDVDYEGLGAEALMDIKTHVRVDAIVFGKMAPDWSAARMIMVETTMGEPILNAVLKPAKGKAFASADDVAQEALRVLTAPK